MFGLRKKSQAEKAFEYDATVNKGRHRAPSTKLASERVILPNSKRKKMLATVQDQIRNAAILAWAVRHHLDYVSRFRFQFRSGNDKLDKLVKRIFDWHAQPRNFDIAGRLGREEAFRLFEAEKVTAGDAGLLKLKGTKIQAIESDLLAKPTKGKPVAKNGNKTYETLPEEINDVDKDTGAVLSLQYPGKVEQWCICNRGWDGNSLAFDHLEPSENLIFDAYYSRFSSQVRGVSPLSSAINTIQDLYEGFEWNLLKSKIHAIFGVAIMRDTGGGTSDQEEVSAFGGASGITSGADENLEDTEANDYGTKAVSSSLQKLTPDSMIMVDMEAKGKIDTIESHTPSNEFREFSEMMIRVALLAIDLPYTAFDSQKSSFSAQIADLNLYEVACEHKRDKNRWARQNYSDWLLVDAWNNPKWGLRETAAAAGINYLNELQALVEWIPSGVPWLQKLQEVQGDRIAISLGLDNSIDACRKRGTDFFENIRKQAIANQFAKDNNVPLMIGESGQETVVENEPEKQETQPAEGN